MKKILVTGGAGFIGSNFIRHMLNKYQDYTITNLDKLTYCGNLTNLKDIAYNTRYKFIHGDICDYITVAATVQNCDTIINFAAESHVDKSIANPLRFINTNLYGTYALLEAAKKYGTSLFCQISTDEVYGSKDSGSFRETDTLKPSNPYAASKAAAELLAYSYHKTYNLPVIVTRSANNFGSHQHPEKVIPLFITNAIKNKSLTVHGDGRNIRDWIHVANTCETIDFIIHKGKPGETYNIAGHNEIENLKLAQLILRIMNKPQSLITLVKDRPGNDQRYALNSTKLKQLGWVPQHNFDRELRETVEWYCNNKDWWEGLV